MAKQRVRIRLKAFDLKILDSSAEKSLTQQNDTCTVSGNPYLLIKVFLPFCVRFMFQRFT